MKSEVLNELLKNGKINNGQSGKILGFIDYVVSNEKFHIFEEVMNDVQENYFVNDAIHGISHNERVAFLAMAIGINENLTGDELKVIIKAALYHDIGRTTAKGRTHGTESARIIAENRDVLANGFDDKELALLEFLCSIHSNPDEELDNFAKQYSIDISIATKLMNVLKDADALDRVRLPRFGKINEDMLRLDYSRGLVQTAKELLSSYKSVQYDLGMDFNIGAFETDRFNVIEDDENIYIFRALNHDNELDMDNPDIDIIRSKSQVIIDNDGITKYSKDSEISLEEVYSSVKVARSGKNNNCISFSSNSNVTLDYEARRYIMYAVPKNGDESTYLAGKYMLEEISKKISSRLKNEKIDNEVLEILAQIDAEDSAKGIAQLVGESFNSIKANTQQNRKLTRKREDLTSRESLLSRFENKQFLDESQNIEYVRIIAKLTILERHGTLRSILPTQSTNSFLISAVGSAFSSSEFIHYGDIPKEKAVEISRETVELFSIIQQMQEQGEIDNEIVSLLKLKVLESIKSNNQITIDDNIEQSEFSGLSPESAIDYFRAGSETGKIIPYYAGNTAMKYIKNYAHAKVRTYELLSKLKDEFTDKKQKQSVDALINKIITKVVVPDSSIVGRRNNRGIKLAESVNLDINPSKEITIFSIDEQEKLISSLNGLSYEELTKIANGDFSLINEKRILTNCIQTKDYQNGKNGYFIDYILDSIDLEQVYKVSNVRYDKRSSIKEKLGEKLGLVDVHKLYSALTNAGIGYEAIPNYIINLLLEDGYGEYSTFEELVNSEKLDEIIKENVNNLNNNITAYSLDSFLGILDNSYMVPNTHIVLREYQEAAVNGVDDIFETNRFAGVVLPTGAGKSFVAMAELAKFQKKNIMYFAPQEEILNQFQKHILKHILNKSVLTIEDISKMESMTDSQKREFLMGKVYNQSVDIAGELKKLRKGSLTEEEKDKIKRRMLPRKNEKHDDVMDAIKLVFPHLEMHCYQSLNGSEYQNLLKKNADLIVFDELHRAGAKTWQPLINQLLKHNEYAKILGITATPVRDDADHADMMKYMAEKYGGFTKEEIDDKDYLAEEMYLIDAMQNKYVVEPQIVSFSSSLANTEEYQFVVERINEEKKNNPSSELVKELEIIKNGMDEIINGGRKSIRNNLPAVGKVIEENIPVSLKNGRFIVFLPRKNDDFDGTSEEYIQSQIEKINGMLKSVNPNIDSGYLLSNRQEKSKNAEAISNFETSDNGFLKVLYAINMLNEGVHVDNINGEIMLRPIGSGSNILYFQQIGRVIYSIDPKNPPSEDEVPIIFDVYNNYLTRDLDRSANTTTPTSDLNNVQMVRNWINRHERMPDINSYDQDEARKAIILKKIQEKYEGYLNGINNENLSETEIREIKKILEIARSINLFDIDIPDRIIPPGEKELGRVNAFEIRGEVKSFLDLFKKSKKIIKEHGKASKVESKMPKSLRIRNVMSILQILNEYGFNITDEHLREIYTNLNPDNREELAKENLTLLDVLEKGFTEKSKAVIIRELGMDLDELKEFNIYKEFDYARATFYSSDGSLKKAFSYFDIKDIRKCGLLKSNGDFTPAVKSGFITERGPKAFRDINIYTGTNYDKDGYNVNGYDFLGYDREGYDALGYDKDFFLRGDSINKYGFNRDKINTETNTHLDKRFFDFEGNYWKADPEFPDDITKRINTYEKVDENGLDRDGVLFVRDKDGILVPKFPNGGFFDLEGNYWKADSKFPHDITKRINTYKKVNEDGFDKDGYYYTQNENGEWVNTGNRHNEAGFDCEHLFHRIAKNGNNKTRNTNASGKYDDEGYDFYGLDRHWFNRDHMYVDEDGNVSFLNPSGVGYDGYLYEFDEKTQSYTKKEKYYDDEGYDFDGLDECLFDREHLYMHTKKWTPYLFDWEHEFRSQPGRKFDNYGFDYKQDYQGILGRKYDDNNFDRDGYLYRLNPETNQMEKTNDTINDQHFDRDGYYYEFDENSGEYTKTIYKTNPHGIYIDGRMRKESIRDKEFLYQLIESEREEIIQSVDEPVRNAEHLVETFNTLKNQVQEKEKRIPSHLRSQRPMEYINNALRLCEEVKKMAEEARKCPEAKDVADLSEKIKSNIKEARKYVKSVEDELVILDEKIVRQENREKQLEEKVQKRKSERAAFEAKFDENGICRETGLRYDQYYFTINGTNVITKIDVDMRGFEFSGRCRSNDFLPYDKNGFKMDGTHYETGERYYKGYNAYGVDENGKIVKVIHQEI